jgi:hypothetical protein
MLTFREKLVIVKITKGKATKYLTIKVTKNSVV